MKNHILKFIAFSILCVFAISTQAQTEKGRLMVGANFSQMRFALGQNQSQIGFNVQPSFGRFVANNFALGTRWGMGFNYSHNGATDFGSKGFSISPSVFGRYYVPVSKNVRPFVELETGAAQTFSKAGGINYRSSSVYAQGSAGAAFFFAKNASIDLSVGYRFSQGLSGPATGHFSAYPQAKIGFNLFLPSGSREK